MWSRKFTSHPTYLLFLGELISYMTLMHIHPTTGTKILNQTAVNSSWHGLIASESNRRNAPSTDRHIEADRSRT
jgi:hypothetical protein